MSKTRPGIWLPLLRAEIETIKIAHKRPCCICGKIPKERRLRVCLGTGRSGGTRIFCKSHGHEFITRRMAECARAVRYLATGEGNIRKDDRTLFSPSFRAGRRWRKGQEVEIKLAGNWVKCGYFVRATHDSIVILQYDKANPIEFPKDRIRPVFKKKKQKE